mmetsp:Transcript_77995/g.253052  ORF Transcript_77995/g.253052 Transcript_77995/m.253052 type:complete len:213 (-) Transcript_77995:24-662(-)
MHTWTLRDWTLRARYRAAPQWRLQQGMADRRIVGSGSGASSSDISGSEVVVGGAGSSGAVDVDVVSAIGASSGEVFGAIGARLGDVVGDDRGGRIDVRRVVGSASNVGVRSIDEGSVGPGGVGGSGLLGSRRRLLRGCRLHAKGRQNRHLPGRLTLSNGGAPRRARPVRAPPAVRHRSSILGRQCSAGRPRIWKAPAPGHRGVLCTERLGST